MILNKGNSPSELVKYNVSLLQYPFQEHELHVSFYALYQFLAKLYPHFKMFSLVVTSLHVCKLKGNVNIHMKMNRNHLRHKQQQQSHSTNEKTAVTLQVR